MKLVTFLQNGAERLGVSTPQGVIDVAAAHALSASELPAPASVHEVMERGADALLALEKLTQRILASEETRQACLLDEASLTLAPCVPKPNKIICVGLNYRRHAEET